ncbi:MAG TPA: amidohydrolase, partial [Sphingomicrobium sp.]|nr:amidohydrolase [Sphingomicrobium sp.]
MMRQSILAGLLTAAASIAVAAPTPKEQLLVPPAGARHYTITSTAGKHGDMWSWTLPNGQSAYRMSMSLRGWVTEDDELITTGADGRPTAIAIRGYTDQGDATEDFNVDGSAVAHWKTSIDAGAAPYAGKRYNTYGGPPIAVEKDIDALVAAGPTGIDLLPSGHASISIGPSVQIEGPQGPRTVKLAFVMGYGFSPSPVWLDEQNHFFGTAGLIAVLPEGFEKNAAKLKDVQDAATAAMVRNVAHQFLQPRNHGPTLVDHVLMFDSIEGRYIPDRAVLIADGKVAAIGPAGSIKAPAGAA